MQCQLHRFENGVRLVTVAMPHMFSACVGVWTAVGSRHESKPLNGVSHFLEHMLFKGTRRRNGEEISTAVESLGGDINAFTSEDHTCYYAKADGRHLVTLVDVLMDMYTGAIFPAVEVRREREVILEEISMYRDQPGHRLDDLLAAVLWPSHALGRSITGSEESVEALTRQDLLMYWKKHYNTRSTVISVAGNIDHDEVVAMLAPHVAKLPIGRQPGSRAPLAMAHQSRVRTEDLPVEQCHFGIGVETFGRKDPRRFALKLGNTILGGNMSSRLFQKLREKQGLCYSVSSEMDLFSNTGALSVIVGLDPKNQRRAIRSILDEIDRMVQNLVTTRELRSVKDYALGHLRMGLESTTNCMFYAGESVLGFGTPVRVAEVEDYVQSVTREDIRAAFQAVILPQNLRGAVVGPSPEKEFF